MDKITKPLKEHSISVSITLYPGDLALLYHVGKNNGLNGVSAALRFILADWRHRIISENGRDKLPAPE